LGHGRRSVSWPHSTGARVHSVRPDIRMLLKLCHVVGLMSSGDRPSRLGRLEPLGCHTEVRESRTVHREHVVCEVSGSLNRHTSGQDFEGRGSAAFVGRCAEKSLRRIEHRRQHATRMDHLALAARCSQLPIARIFNSVFADVATCKILHQVITCVGRTRCRATLWRNPRWCRESARHVSIAEGVEPERLFGLSRQQAILVLVHRRCPPKVWWGHQ